MQSRIARLRFIFDYGRGDSFYRSLTDMGPLERPNNPMGVTGSLKDTGNEASVGAHKAIEQASEASRPIVDTTGSARTVR
jgi:hypothetical protein